MSITSSADHRTKTGYFYSATFGYFYSAIDTALLYAGMDWRVLPVHTVVEGKCTCGKTCANPGKHPATAHGVKDASTDQSKIQRWFARPRNIGIATGAESGFFVLDVDDGGEATITAWEKEHGSLPPTWQQRTGSGGRHILFRHPGENIPNRVKTLGGGLDLRGDGGYIVVAPSTHISGNRYEWLASPTGDVALADAPSWLLEKIRTPPRKSPVEPFQAKPSRSFSPTIQGGIHPYAAAALKGELRRVTSANEGNRNDILNIAAVKLGHLVGESLPEATVRSELLAAALAVGLGQEEAERTIDSGLAVGMADPRAIPTMQVPSLLRQKRQEIADLIEASEDFDELTGPIAQQVAECGLPETTILSLRKFIAKKAGVSVASLEKDARGFATVGADKDVLHLKAALETVVALGGKENLLFAVHALWAWRGDGVWREIDDREAKQAIHKVVTGDELTKSVADSILDLVKTEVFRPGHSFEQGGDVVNMLNGELSFNQGKWELLPHNREHYRITRIPVAFDPTATAPRFEHFLTEIFAGDEDAREKAILVCELLGYSLLPTCRFEKFALLIGNGANGKSVLLSVVEALAGRENVAAVQPSQFENRFQRAHLHGRLVNLVTEISEGAEIADAQLKAIVSGELTTAEHKHKPPFDFHPIATCWFGTNHLPHTRDFSDALFRRAIVIPFNRKFEGENCDPHLKEKLLAELPGILNLAMEGIAGVLDRGLFTIPASCESMKKSWRTEVDQAAQFVEEMCDLEPGIKTPSQDVWHAYSQWADDAGIKRTLNRNNFTSRLKRLGIEDNKGTKGIRLLVGVRLKPAMEGGSGWRTGGAGWHTDLGCATHATI